MAEQTKASPLRAVKGMNDILPPESWRWEWLEGRLRTLVARYGPDLERWRWGDAHPAVIAHPPFERSAALRPLFSLVLPIGGDGTTIAVAHAGTTRPDIPFGAVHAPGYRGIYDLADPQGSRWIAATGQSGHPLSRHYRDLAWLWQVGAYLPMQPTSENASSTAHLLVLRPSVAP